MNRYVKFTITVIFWIFVCYFFWASYNFNGFMLKKWAIILNWDLAMTCRIYYLMLNTKSTVERMAKADEKIYRRWQTKNYILKLVNFYFGLYLFNFIFYL